MIKLFQILRAVLAKKADVINIAVKLRQERHLCRPRTSLKPSPVGAAYCANQNFPAVMFHFYVAPDGA